MGFPSVRSAGAVIVLAWTVGLVRAAAGGPQLVVVPFERAPSPYIVIRVPVAGRGCEAMIFATGTNTTVLDPSLAGMARLATGRVTTVESLGGAARAITGEVRGLGFDGIPAKRPTIAAAASLAGFRSIGPSIRGLYGHDWLAGTD